AGPRRIVRTQEAHCLASEELQGNPVVGGGLDDVSRQLKSTFDAACHPTPLCGPKSATEAEATRVPRPSSPPRRRIIVPPGEEGAGLKDLRAEARDRAPMNGWRGARDSSIGAVVVVDRPPGLREAHP